MEVGIEDSDFDPYEVLFCIMLNNGFYQCSMYSFVSILKKNLHINIVKENDNFKIEG